MGDNKNVGIYTNNARLAVSPKSDEEASQYGNTLADLGNYPVGLGGCFCVGISGGCGKDCYVYKQGKCSIQEEINEVEQ